MIYPDGRTILISDAPTPDLHRALQDLHRSWLTPSLENHGGKLRVQERIAIELVARSL